MVWELTIIISRLEKNKRDCFKVIKIIYGYIYKITNLVNEKVYIGQTTKTIKKRWKVHLYSINYYNYHLYYSMRKYGIENFIIEQICVCEDHLSLNLMEDLCIFIYDSMNSNNGYNKRGGGSHGKHSEESKRKTSRKKKKWDLVPENKKKHKKATKKAMNRPEIKERLSKKMKERYEKDPERRKRQTKKMREAGKKYWKKKKQEYEKAKQENDFINMKGKDLYELAKDNNVVRKSYMNKQDLINYFIYFSNFKIKKMF